jgi:hypothetical protein
MAANKGTIPQPNLPGGTDAPGGPAVHSTSSAPRDVQGVTSSKSASKSALTPGSNK